MVLPQSFDFRLVDGRSSTYTRRFQSEFATFVSSTLIAKQPPISEAQNRSYWPRVPAFRI